ncbi:MAG: dihydrofolate reductase family protein [Bauldia sp.]|nr:dihydrofolate reductase family protein [Bauldia sp.]MCW5717768.1 dihydrofolate reductase family protein [Bauldia sp.]
MAKVSFNMSVSLDGFVAGPNHEVDEVFAWYGAGDTDFLLPGARSPFRVSAASARYLAAHSAGIGALVTGRRTFDLAGAWQGQPPLGVPCVVMTHRPPAEWTKEGSPFTFVDTVEDAIATARRLAGGRDIALGTPSVLRQALDRGVVDEVSLDMASVMIGQGIPLARPTDAPVRLERIEAVEGTGVTHLRFRVLR